MSAILFSGDLFFSSRVRPAAEGAGHELAVVVSQADLQAHLEAATDTKLVIIDLSTASDVAGVIQMTKSCCPAARIIAYGPHVQTGKLQAASDAGCDQVMTNGQFDQNLTTVFKSV